MPFGEYADMDACVAANSDKEDPKAFCSTMMEQAEKAAKADAAKRFKIAKVDEAERLVFGWASVAIKADGQQLEDLQGDLIDPVDLEKAAYDFMLFSRNADEMHSGRVKGQMVESLFVSPEKLESMGLASKRAPKSAWWVGFKFDAETFAKVKAGDYTMFSIEGRAERVTV